MQANIDWSVECSCGAEYTPKSRSEPNTCYSCGSDNIAVTPMPNGVKHD